MPEDEVALERRNPWWVGVGKQRAVMTLRHRPGGACVFLDEANRCTIYEHRPVACREHPFNVRFTETGAVERVSLSGIVDCPHDWDGHVTRRELRAVSAWNERQTDDYTAKVARWNRSRARKTRPGFLRFLGLAD
jgi:Fe-S-cluster containining protein